MDGKEFVERMTRGDASVFDDLMPELRHIVLGACAALRVFDEVKQDIVQEVAIRVFTGWRSYRLESALGTWIYSIARRHCIDVQRKRIVRSEGPYHKEAGEPSANELHSKADWPSLEHTLCVQQVLAALEAHSESAKSGARMIDVLMWWVLNDPTTKELATYLRTTEGAARERKRFILNKVRALCRKFCGHEECALSPEG